MSTLVKQEPLNLEAPEAPITPMSLLQLATSQNADIDKLKALMELHERWEANQARKAYYAAMKQFKDNPPHITKNGTGHNEARYATLDHACAQIIPALAQVGITHKWNVSAKEGKVTLSCVLSHQLGFSEPDPPTIEAAADTSGSKNAIQALGSSIKYLERYTLFAAVGLDDGAKDLDGAGTKMPDETFVDLASPIEGANTVEDLQKAFAKAYKTAQIAGDKNAMGQFISKKDARKKALGANR